jgi:two-component system OmpR family response regulator
MFTTNPSVAHVLAIDRDPTVRKTIADYFRDGDIRVTTRADGSGLDDVLTRERIDLLILEPKLPGEDGVRVIRRLREKLDLPIIVLTVHNEIADRVMSLELGADDYVTKPFSPRELLARIRALLRRSQPREVLAGAAPSFRAYRFDGWELNVGLRRLTTPQGEKIALTNGEFNLLVAFLSAPQRILSRDQLLALSRLHPGQVYDRTIDVQILRLRRKIQSDTAQTRLIQAERGAGYIFAAPVEVVR